MVRLSLLTRFHEREAVADAVDRTGRAGKLVGAPSPRRGRAVGFLPQPVTRPPTVESGTALTCLAFSFCAFFLKVSLFNRY